MSFRIPQPSEFGGNPLANDDQSLARSTPTEFSGTPAGLDLYNREPAPLGLHGMPNISGEQVLQGIQQIANQPLLPPAAPDANPQMFYSPSTGQMVVNGFSFNQRNATQALASEQFARQPRREFTLPDTASDWRALSPQEYSSYLDTIRNPSFGKRISEAWEGGWRGAGDVAIGAGLAANPNWDWGRQAHANLAREFEENAPFMLELRDVHDVGSGLTYAAQMLVQQVPWFVETIASMAAGAVLGGAVSGGVGAPEGAVEGFLAKESFRQATMRAIRQNLARGAAAYTRALEETGARTLTREQVAASAARNGIASADDVDRFFNFGERAYHLSRGARAENAGNMLSGVGAQVGSFGSNYQMALGDVRNTIADAGGDTESANAMANIWGLALPYAAIESLGDVILTQPLTHLIPGIETGASRFGNALRHGALASISEGGEEGAQYLITQQGVANATNQPITVDPYDLLQNVVGGAIGGFGFGGITGAMERPNRPEVTPPATAVPITPAAPPANPNTNPASFGYSNEDAQAGVGLALEPLQVPGAGTGVSIGGLQPEVAVPQAPPVEAPQEAQTYPGDVFNQGDLLAPAMPTAGITEPPPVHTPEQNQNARQTIDATRRAIVAAGGPAGKAVAAIQQAIANNTIIPDTALHSVDSKIKNEMFKLPVEVQAMAPYFATQIQGVAVEHNKKLIQELQSYIADAKNILTWPEEQLKRAQHLAGEILIGGRQTLPAVHKQNLSEFQGFLHEAIKQRSAVRDNDGLRGRMQEDNLAVQSTNEFDNEDAKKAVQSTVRQVRKEQKPGFGRKDQAIFDAHERERATKKETPIVPDRIKKAGKRIEEAKHAIQEQSTKSVPVREPSKSSERVREAHTQREETPRAREAQSEEVKGIPTRAEVSQDRIDRAHKALVTRAEGLNKNPAQTVRGVLNAIAKAKKDGRKVNLDLIKNPWLQLDKQVLTEEEIRAVANKFSDKYNAATEKKAKTEPVKRSPQTGRFVEPVITGKEVRDNMAAEKKAASFHQDVVEAWRRNKDDPKAFESFVLDNKAETQQWIDSKVAGTLPTARRAAERILGESPIKLAATENKLPRRVIDTPDGNIIVNPTQADLLKETRRRLGKKEDETDTLRYIKDEDGNVFVGPAYYMLHDDIARAAKKAGYKLTGYVNEHESNFSGFVHKLETGQFQRRGDKVVELRDALLGAPKRAAGEADSSSDKITAARAKAVINKVQKNINPRTRFRTTHVFSNVQDVKDRANLEVFMAPGGDKFTLRELILNSVPPLAADVNPDTVVNNWIDNEIGKPKARAFVVTYYDALVVLSDHNNGEDHLLSGLEHEYVAHFGLASIFPDEIERGKFLMRVASIPGIEQKRQELLERAPSYRSYGYLAQIEELIAFHSEKGPLALKQLLSAPEGVDQETKRTLWQDLVRQVAEWLNRVFGINRAPEDKILDAVVAGLREHAITGEAVNLNMILDANGVRTFESVRAQTPGLNVKFAVTPMSQEDTFAVLTGAETNPGRPYTPTPWGAQMDAILRSNLPLMEKLQELSSKGTGTSVREALRKVGRNLETMGNMAQRSVLIQKLMAMMHNTIGTARSIMTKIQETRTYATKAEELAPIRGVFGDKDKGSTKAQRDAYGRLAIVATINKLAQATEDVIRAAPRLLIRDANGMYSINKDVFEKLLKLGTFSKEDFEKGIDQFVVSGDGKATKTGTAKLSKKDIDDGYDIYVSETRHMAQSMLTRLEHMTIMLNQKNDVAVARILRDNDFKETDQPFVNETLQRMYKLYTDIAFHNYASNSKTARTRQSEMARQVLVELMRTMHSKEKLADWTDASRERQDTAKSPRKQDAFKWREQANPADEVKPFVDQVRWFLDNDPGTGKNRLERMNEIYNSIDGQRQYKMLGAFQSLLNSELQAHQFENKVIQSILGNYIELTRKGEWRVFVEVQDEEGNKLSVSPELQAALPVSFVGSQREAQELQAKLAEELKGTFTINGKDGSPMQATFDIGVEKAPGTSTLADAPKLKEFLQVADLVGLKLSATQMKQIANLIENSESRKRYGLQRAGVPGMNAEVLKQNGETLTRNAWIAAKMSQSWMMDGIFHDKKNLYGDWKELQRLQDQFDIANRGAIEGQAPPTNFVRNQAKVYLAETALLRYANQLRHMAQHKLSRPNVVIRTTKGEQKFKIEPEAQAHLAHAKALEESLKRDTLEVNLNDLLSKTGPLRMVAVVSQLGSIAAGVMNTFTLVTHLPWVLQAHHEKTGYGEGFNMTETASEIMSAASQVMFRLKMKDSAGVKKLLDDAKAGNNNTGLTIPELEFMYQETLDGLLAPQQTYSMTGGTESNIGSVIARNLAQGLMEPFGAMEAANRRVSALATYRLAKARYIAAGVSEEKLNDPESDEYKQLVQDVQRVVYQSQGDYTNVNRPKGFRGDLAQYVLMYKMFPLMTQIMLYNLPLKQQLAFLGILLLLGGLKGEPFADDFMDIYDTLLQKLGFRHDSVELGLTQTLEKIMPGSSKWVMYGGIDALTFGGTMSSRVSMGDIIPFTGAFREGADFGREIANAFGPAYAGNVAILEEAWLLTDFTMQAMGLKPQVTSFEELVRKFPQAQFRALGEAGLMAGTGQITDPQGRLTSDNVDVFSIFSRALGFYPLEATKANTAVRLDRMHTNYMRAIRARFVLAYANAYRTHNQERMDAIAQQVNDWNNAVEATGQDDMRIRNFLSAARRAGHAASQTAVERTSAGAPDYSVLDEVAGILNADTQTDEETGN